MSRSLFDFQYLLWQLSGNCSYPVSNSFYHLVAPGLHTQDSLHTTRANSVQTARGSTGAMISLRLQMRCFIINTVHIKQQSMHQNFFSMGQCNS